jgi:hypothetical protein
VAPVPEFLRKLPVIASCAGSVVEPTDSVAALGLVTTDRVKEADEVTDAPPPVFSTAQRVQSKFTVESPTVRAELAVNLTSVTVMPLDVDALPVMPATRIAPETTGPGVRMA